MGIQEVIEKIVNGVAVVTSKKGEKVNGLSVAWMSQVCYEPPLVMISVGKARLTHEFIESSKVFTINILSEKQIDLAKLFGLKSGREVNKFQNVEYEIGETGAPIIKGCVGYLECEVFSSIEVGDHTIYVGKVLRSGSGRDERPLIYNPKDYF